MAIILDEIPKSKGFGQKSYLHLRIFRKRFHVDFSGKTGLSLCLPVQPSEMEVTYALILHGFRPVFRVTHLKPLENTQKTWRQLFYAPRQNIFVQNLEPYD